jgi:hypothetical protein
MQGVVAALASDAETLVPDGPGQARLKALCDPSGILNPDARRKAEGMLREHLRTRGLDEESISGLMAAAQEALNQRIPEEGRKARKAVDEKWEK